MESSWWGDGGPADLKQAKELGHDHLCDTGMPVRNGNFALTELQQQRLQEGWEGGCHFCRGTLRGGCRWFG